MDRSVSPRALYRTGEQPHQDGYRLHAQRRQDHGELQSLNQGQLSIKPDYTSSSFVIDWAKVDHVESKQGFMIMDPRGTIYTGTISKGAENRTMVVDENATATLPFDSVIQIEQLGRTFLRRFRGDFDLGSSFAKSNDLKSLTLQGDLGYQSDKNLFSLNFSSQWTSQRKTSNTDETTVKTALFRQLRKSNWYAGGIANFLSSSEQQVSLRSTLGAALATRPIFTNRNNLTVVSGLALTLERDSQNAVSSARTEALDSAFSLEYSTFRFDSTTFNTSVWLYPSLTSPGRVRMTLNQDVYYKFLHDFYVRLSFYDNYDNQPVVGAPTNNFGGSTTLGWSFH
ncbi:DUF481 domain-containing protein [Edaphobacter bradus]|uniref:DUF481 domain-containing protein n=1 Tax=Edaphobacter bradus TaxID=2259016 RepID=UPI0021DFDC69|nr:DUF481 domain-containing protein [Edaphobacter bradus]